MSNEDSNRGAQARASDRIAKAESHRPAVDANGRRIGKPVRFSYDADGRLVDVVPEPPEAA
jgi:hypothetical protein